MGVAGVRADFSATPTGGTAPLTVHFTNLSEPAEKITSYLWDFGDGTPTSTDTNPTHVYAQEGSYTVSLSIIGDGDTDTATKSSFINVTDVIFADGFEGGLSTWTNAVTGGGDLSVTPAAAMVGTLGLQAVINDTSPIYVRDDTPNNESRYRARFYFDPNGIEMANYDTHSIFYGYNASTHILVVDFRIANGVYQVRALTLSDTGTWRISNYYPISDGPHYLELDWQAASANGANDGYLTLYIDGVQQTSVVGIDNDTRRIERVALGAVTGIDATTHGTYFFDAFESRRTSYIGLEGIRADFSSNPTGGAAPLTVHFSSLSQPAPEIISYLWDFGDGTPTSTDTNPTHVYTQEGSYTVSLTVSGDGDTDTMVKTGYINVTDLIFDDGFEQGNLLAWSAAANGGGDLSVTPGAALVGTLGLQAVINDTSPIFVRDDTPFNEARYRARFYFDPNGITMANYDTHSIFYGYSASTHILVVDFRIVNGVYQVRALTLSDTGSWRISNYYPISDGPHSFELDWQAASAVGANDGYLTLWIDGVQRAILTAIDNDTRRIERVALGAVTGIDATTSGIYFFDAFEIQEGKLDRAVTGSHYLPNGLPGENFSSGRPFRR